MTLSCSKGIVRGGGSLLLEQPGQGSVPKATSGLLEELAAVHFRRGEGRREEGARGRAEFARFKSALR